MRTPARPLPATRPPLAVAVAVALAACGGGAGTSSLAAAPPPGSERGGTSDLVAARAEVARAPADASRTATDGSPAGRGEAAVERKIVRDASLTLEVPKQAAVAPALRAAHRVAAQTGGFVFSETNDEVVLKVPAERLDDALARLGKVAHVSDKRVSARDVTADYVDLAIRIDNARKLRARLQELLAQTQDVGKLLDVEKELARVTEHLERLEGQMRLLTQQTTYATVTVKVEEKVTPGPVGWVFYGLYAGVKWLFVWD